MPSRPSLWGPWRSFCDQLAQARAFRACAASAGPAGSRLLSQAQLYYAIEMSFVKLFLAWEDFLEETFVRFVCGAHYCRGGAPMIVRPTVPTDLPAGLAALKRRPTDRYIDWVDTAEVVRRAHQWFDLGEPYATAVGGIAVSLERARRIRHRIVHRSDAALQDYRAVATSLFGSRSLRGMCPGRLLTLPLLLPAPGSPPFLDQFEREVGLAADHIVKP